VAQTIKQNLFTSFFVITSITAKYFSLILSQPLEDSIKQLYTDPNHVLLQTIKLKQ
jgi:hypothetical protein